MTSATRSSTWLTRLIGLPLLARFVVIGAVGAGALGAVAGLIVGLFVYAPTAWFAIIEAGVPAAILGATLGLVIGAAVLLIRSARPHYSFARRGSFARRDTAER